MAMEDAPKKSNKSMPPAAIKIGAGAGSFGIGGIVLLGGALAAATLVSALAIKTKIRQQPPPPPPPPIKKDFIIKLPPHSLQSSHNPSSDDMEEMQSEPAHNLILDEKQHGEMENDGDGNELLSVIGEDEESSCCVNNVPERGDHNHEHEKIPLDDEEGANEQKFNVPVDDAYTDSKPLIISMEEEKEEDCALVEEKDITVDAPQVADAVEDEDEDEDEDANIPIGDVGEDQTKMLFVKEEAIQEQVRKAACMHQNEVQNTHQVPFLEKEEDTNDEIIMVINGEGNSTEAAFSDQIVREKNQQQMQYNRERAMEEEKSTEATCVNLVNVQDILEMELMKEEEKSKESEHEGDVIVERFEELVKIAHHEDAQQLHLSEVHEINTNEDDLPPKQLMNDEENVNKTAHEVQEDMITEDELIKKGEKGKDDEITHVQLIESDDEAHHDDHIAIREDNPPRGSINKEENIKGEIITEDELMIKKDIEGVEDEEDEIPHVDSIEGATIWPDESIHKELTPETKIEETMRRNGGEKKMEKEMSFSDRFMMELAKESKQTDSRKLKLRTWSVLVPMWCLCLFHWYFELPLLKLNLVCSFLSILILLAIQNPTTYLAKYR